MPKRSELKITKRALDALSVEAGDALFWDRGLAGFGVRVHATGRKVYVAQSRGPDGPPPSAATTSCSPYSPRASSPSPARASPATSSTRPAASASPSSASPHEAHTSRVASPPRRRGPFVSSVVHPGASAVVAVTCSVTASYRGGDANPASSVGPPVRIPVHTSPHCSTRFRPLSRRGGSRQWFSPASIPPSFVLQVLVLLTPFDGSFFHTRRSYSAGVALILCVLVLVTGLVVPSVTHGKSDIRQIMDADLVGVWSTGKSYIWLYEDRSMKALASNCSLIGRGTWEFEIGALGIYSYTKKLFSGHVLKVPTNPKMGNKMLFATMREWLFMGRDTDQKC